MNKSLLEKLRRENPEIFKLLKKCENLEEARKKLFKFSKDLDMEI